MVVSAAAAAVSTEMAKLVAGRDECTTDFDSDRFASDVEEDKDDDD